MSFSFMRKVDRIFGPLILAVLYPVILMVGAIRFVFKPRLEPTEITNITVAKFVGMGSVLLATPLLAKIKVLFPNARLTFLTFHENRRLVEHIESIDHIETIENKNFFTLVSSLFRFVFFAPRAELFIDLEFFSHFGLIVQTLSLARYRIGFWERGFLFRSLLLTHRAHYNPLRHISKIFMNMLCAFNSDLEKESFDADIRLPYLNYSVAAERRVRQLIPVDLKNYSLILVNPHASDLSYLRRWPFEHYRELIRQLLNLPYHIVATIGGPKDVDYNNTLIEPFIKQKKFVDLCGKLSIDELIAAISLAELFVTNDSGPLHIANAQQTSVIAFFGPESPTTYGPIGLGEDNPCRVFYRGLYCSPCMNTLYDKMVTCKSNRCLKLISVERVMVEVKQILEKKVPEAPSRKKSYNSRR
ncbi:MAG: glycosyltransferase family 9 protein [Deltaproteobacteria bacterium]|nr:glycosyltransferase family 9 protein [Deltaproteobacteria bacterium]